MISTLFCIPSCSIPLVDPKKVSQDSTRDLVKNSAVNFYDGVTQAEVEAYYKSIADEDDPTPISYGLNSRVVKKDGKVVEEIASVNGLYGPAIEKIVYWLDKAAGVAENDPAETGDSKNSSSIIKPVIWKSLMNTTSSGYNDVDSSIDFVNGFIEVYNDPLGMKASWESVVNFKDLEATKRTINHLRQCPVVRRQLPCRSPF